MKQYLDLLQKVLDTGVKKKDRTSTGVLSSFGHQMHFDISETFPLITTKKIHLKSVIHELLWFIKGSTNTKYLEENGVSIWNEWANERGELGPVYGKQWRSWQAADGSKIDQLKGVVDSIKKNPDSRRHIVSAWNVGELKDMALPPCHSFFQFYVSEGELSLQLYQRSADMFLGVPFNIASYSLLIMMVAHICNLKPRNFIHTVGDAHIYINHLDQVKKQLSRLPKKLPKISILRKVECIDDFKYEDFSLIGYDPYPGIKAPIAV